MTLLTRHTISTFSTKTLWILFIVFHQINLVICDDFEEGNLKKALEAIEHRQRDLELQENEYYGQPENIGYGFQKTLGFFDSNGPATELGSFDSNPMSENEFQNILYNYQQARNVGEKRKSNFRERMTNDRFNYLVNDGIDKEEYPQTSIEYLQMLKNLWSKYRQSVNDDIGLEDLSDEELDAILNSLYARENSDYRPYQTIPIRTRKSYRVFEGLRDKTKRYPSFGEGFYGKRNYNSPYGGYESPSDNDFPYSVKYANPDTSREEVENSREMTFEDLNDAKERDIIRILNGVINHPKYSDDEGPYWPKEQTGYDNELWLQEPVTVSDEWYDSLGRNEKRLEMAPKYFKPHNGIHLNAKRFPVKRSSVRVRKEARSDKVTKEELKGIFAPAISTTIVPSKKNKKDADKKATSTLPLKPQQQKKNFTKPAVTKHHETKKVVRSAEKIPTKERVIPIRQNEEIVNLFNGDGKSITKKSIDWSQYFGIDKRGRSNNWLNEDYLTRSENHFLGPARAKKQHMTESEYGPAYQVPFDTRRFTKKNYETDMGSSIDKVETKIGDIEEKIIDDALKYTGAHSGMSGDDLNGVKTKVIQHLEAAYSLEKMKNALEEFKTLIRPAPGERTDTRFDLPKKTVTESTNAPPSAQTTSSSSKEAPNIEKPDVNKKSSTDSVKVGKTKKEGVKGIFSREPENLEFLNEAVYPDRSYDNEECPVLDQVLQNCVRLEEIGGKYAELLVPLCSLQQLCYFCGAEIGFSKMSMCDSMYLTEAQNICQDNRECLMNARDSLMALRDLYEQDLTGKNSRGLLSGSCLANPCVRRYFLNSPGAIYSLEVQK